MKSRLCLLKQINYYLLFLAITYLKQLLGMHNKNHRFLFLQISYIIYILTIYNIIQYIYFQYILKYILK